MRSSTNKSLRRFRWAAGASPKKWPISPFISLRTKPHTSPAARISSTAACSATPAACKLFVRSFALCRLCCARLVVPPPQRRERLLLRPDFIERRAFEKFAILHHVLDQLGVVDVHQRILLQNNHVR